MAACVRCEGLLVWEPAMPNPLVRWSLGAWRCVNCGEWFDWQTFHNRRDQRESYAVEA